MKKILIIIGITSSIAILAIMGYADTAVVGSMWQQEGSTVSPADDVVAVDLEDINLLFDTPGAYLQEDNNGGSGSMYTLGTTFTSWTTANASSATTGLIVDESASTITIGAGLGGRYIGVFHASFKAPSGATITAEITKNGSTKVDDIVRSMAKGPERLPTFRSISSDDSSATFDTHSSLPNLFASDGDDIIIQEAGTGSTGCFFFKIRYAGIDIPNKIEVLNSVYQSNQSTHWANVKILNSTLSSYTSMNRLPKDYEDVGATIEPYERVSYSFQVPSPLIDYVDGSGVTEILFIHNDVSCADSHRFHVDATHVIDLLSSAAVAFPIEFSVVPGDVLSIRLKANKSNTTLKISDMGLNIFKIGL